MKIVYIAHPISGDIKGNLNKIIEIVRHVNLNEPDVVPFAPYYADCIALNDNIESERERGIKNDTALFKKGFVVDELRLYGNRISRGMKAEIKLAKQFNIRIVPMTRRTAEEYIKLN